jgi:hypothetical protein
MPGIKTTLNQEKPPALEEGGTGKDSERTLLSMCSTQSYQLKQ